MRFFLGMLCGAAFLFLVSAAGSDTDPKVITIRGFEMVDQKGDVVCSLLQYDKGGTYLQFSDPKQVSVSRIGISEDREGFVSLSDGKGERMAAISGSGGGSLSIGKIGSPSVSARGGDDPAIGVRSVKGGTIHLTTDESAWISMTAGGKQPGKVSISAEGDAAHAQISVDSKDHEPRPSVFMHVDALNADLTLGRKDEPAAAFLTTRDKSAK